jgi:putative transposase
MGVTGVKDSRSGPQANAYCERLIGSSAPGMSRLVIPLSEKHLRKLVREWPAHYNHGRPHLSLGPGIPDPPRALPVKMRPGRHIIPGIL